MFYLLFICSCLIVRSKIHFSESLCFIGTSQFISSVHDLTRFCLMWVLAELNLRTHLRIIFVLCVPFYKPPFDIVYLIAIRFSIIDVSSYQEQWRNWGWGGGCKWYVRTALKKLLPFFALFQKCLFQLRPFCNEGNVLTSGILEISDRRKKIAGFPK